MQPGANRFRAEFEQFRMQAVFSCCFAILEIADNRFKFGNSWHIEIAVVLWRSTGAGGGVGIGWSCIVVDQFKEVFSPPQ